MIDVLIPVFNAAATIESAIASIQRQTVRDIRIIVVDDGSTDDSALRVERLAAEDGRIELVRQANGGIVDALNAGLARCRAPLVARHDGDDLAYPERFARQAALLEREPGTVAVGGAARHIDGAGHPTGHVARFEPPEGAEPTAAPSREPYILHPLLTVRRAALERVGGYRYVFHAEDTDLYWRLQELGALRNLDEVLCDYRVHAGSVTSASMVNGRLSAVFSQRAGLSAARRRAGRPDLGFPKSLQAECATQRDTVDILRVASRELDGREADLLAIMVAGKIMSLASFRPFELDAGDCRFVRDAMVRHAGLLTPLNAQILRMTAWSTASRLVATGRVRDALSLVPPAELHHVLPRLAFRTVLTPRVQKLLRRSTGRPDHVK